VVTVIAALYDQRQPSQQQEANTWLMAFTATPAAWEMGVNLLGTGQSTEASVTRTHAHTHTHIQTCLHQLCQEINPSLVSTPVGLG
jgi:hypothetical protein